MAFTWGRGDTPKEGGTLDTWTKCKGVKVHIPLDSLQSDVEAKCSTQKRKSDFPDLNKAKLKQAKLMPVVCLHSSGSGYNSK